MVGPDIAQRQRLPVFLAGHRRGRRQGSDELRAAQGEDDGAILLGRLEGVGADQKVERAGVELERAARKAPVDDVVVVGRGVVVRGPDHFGPVGIGCCLEDLLAVLLVECAVAVDVGGVEGGLPAGRQRYRLELAGTGCRHRNRLRHQRQAPLEQRGFRVAPFQQAGQPLVRPQPLHRADLIDDRFPVTFTQQALDGAHLLAVAVGGPAIGHPRAAIEDQREQGAEAMAVQMLGLRVGLEHHPAILRHDRAAIGLQSRIPGHADPLEP